MENRGTVQENARLDKCCVSYVNSQSSFVAANRIKKHLAKTSHNYLKFTRCLNWTCAPDTNSIRASTGIWPGFHLAHSALHQLMSHATDASGCSNQLQF